MDANLRRPERLGGGLRDGGRRAARLRPTEPRGAALGFLSVLVVLGRETLLDAAAVDLATSGLRDT